MPEQEINEPLEFTSLQFIFKKNYNHLTLVKFELILGPSNWMVYDHLGISICSLIQLDSLNAQLAGTGQS